MQAVAQFDTCDLQFELICLHGSKHVLTINFLSDRWPRLLVTFFTASFDLYHALFPSVYPSLSISIHYTFYKSPDRVWKRYKTGILQLYDVDMLPSPLRLTRGLV